MGKAVARQPFLFYGNKFDVITVTKSQFYDIHNRYHSIEKV